MRLKAPNITFHLKRKKRKFSPGQDPGKVIIQENALVPQLVFFTYNAHEFIEDKDLTIDEILQKTDNKNAFHWLDVRGLGDINILNKIQNHFKINMLTMEDIVNTHQRPKMEDYDHYLFIVCRMLDFTKALEMQNEQVSCVILKNTLITFQEDYDDVLEPVRQRLKKNIGNSSIRTLGPSYLWYAINDTIIDHYFSVLNRFGDELETIEQHLYGKVTKLIMYRIQEVRRALIIIRKAIWPERDKINEVLRSDSILINKKTKTFLQDVYDHSFQVIDLVESFKEISSSLMDIYLSLVSNRMNEVMKVLTVISSIFIPLTFIAGIYGMNFARENPVTGRVMPNNMPELYQPEGYVYVLAAMGIIALGQIIFFWVKGWFN